MIGWNLEFFFVFGQLVQRSLKNPLGQLRSRSVCELAKWKKKQGGHFFWWFFSAFWANTLHCPRPTVAGSTLLSLGFPFIGAFPSSSSMWSSLWWDFSQANEQDCLETQKSEANNFDHKISYHKVETSSLTPPKKYIRVEASPWDKVRWFHLKLLKVREFQIAKCPGANGPSSQKWTH